MTDLSTLRGVGPRLAARLAKLEIRKIEDLLFHLPLRYQDRTTISPIASLRPGDECLIEGEVQSCAIRFGRRRALLCAVEDQTGSITIRLFHFNKSQQSSLQSGKGIRCFGEIRRGPSGLEMVHPEYRLLQPGKQQPGLETTLTPIYPSTEGLRQRTLFLLTSQALELALHSVEELLPEAQLPQQLRAVTLQNALQALHRPTTPLSAEQLAICRGRVAFEELLAHHLSLQQLRNHYRKEQATPLSQDRGRVDHLLQLLPFSLTTAQQRVIKEIFQDLQQSHPMRRLLQGDVGSGKTIVALSAALHAAESGLQSALMAPTELLARQLFKNINTLLEPLGINVGFLSGGMNIKERRQMVQQIADGGCSIAVGTHALFQKDISFHNLALVIIDEQHRFGVEQRAALKQKGERGSYLPHQLIMTATPIPRTLAMTFYADLDSSVIDELPPGRTPIKTVTVPESRRSEVLQRVHANCLQGRQVYWVCPLIEESEALQCQAATDSAEEIQKQLPDLSVGLLHGRMSAREKDEVMTRFYQGKIQILVATTVVEVGVDVPDASLMIIENAERLGLAQLHQLRGRVGRGALSSSCVLMYRPPLSRDATERLQTIRDTTDGFEIARKDLEMRGAGELLGKRQTGTLQLKIADLSQDQLLIPLVEKSAQQIMAHDPLSASSMIKKLIRRWIPQGEHYHSTG